MILSPNRSPRGTAPVRLVVLHTAEGARTAKALGAYFASPSTQASSHVGIDDQGIEQYVPYDQAAWTLRSGNKISENAELCGFAHWSREEWLGEHRRMLELAAGWVRARCEVRGIPVRKLTPAQVADDAAGVCGHVDWTVGMGDGSHVDPGGAFPWDFVIDLAGGASAPTPDPSPAGLPSLRRGDSGPVVASLQRWLNGFPWKPELDLLIVDGRYGPSVQAVVAAAQAQCGVAGPDADGSIVGPRTRGAFWARGWRP